MTDLFSPARQAEFRELYIDLRGSPQINLNFSPSLSSPSATGLSTSPSDPFRFERGSPSGRPFGGPIRFASPLLSAPIRSNQAFTGYSTEGILRRNNFADVPDGKQGMTNILTNAFGVEYTYADIAVVNDISKTSFDRDRAYVRLYDDQEKKTYRIVQKDTEKTLVNGVAPSAVPLQTISNQTSQIDAFLGSPSTLHGGDGLVGRYYSWNSIYGNAEELASTGGGTYVENQDDEDNPQYASPNDYVQAEPSEIFFSFSENELANGIPVEITKEWNNGFFNFGPGGLHPTFSDNSGVVQYKGFYNTGIPIYNKAGSVSGLGFNQRLYIVEKHGGVDHSQTELAKTTVPVIWKFWKLDENGDRETSEPTIFARYAPKFPDTNSPAYSFTSAADSRVSVNDKLHQNPSAAEANDCPSSVIGDSIGDVYIIAPRIDDTPRALDVSVIPFSQNEYYETELYFILSPRVGNKIPNKTVLLAAHDEVNGTLEPLRADRFHSQNPLKQTNKGESKLFHENKIPKHGSQTDASPNIHKDAFGESTIVGANLGGGTNYRSLLSNTRIRSIYKPPINWNDIYRGEGNEQGLIFSEQKDFGNVFTNLYFDDFNGRVNDFGVAEGNLVIDAHSTPERPVFDTFTYIDKLNRNEIHLSKPTVRLKNKSTKKALHDRGRVRVVPKYVDHRGLKGYGYGSIRAYTGGGPLDEDLCYMSPLFYYGESPSARDVVIPIDYTDDDYIQVFDTSGRPDLPNITRAGFPNIPLNKIVNGAISNTIPQNSPSGVAYPTYHASSKFAQTAAAFASSGWPGHGRDQTPRGEFFFVYHHKGLVDKSLDGFCSLPSHGKRIINALVDVEISPKVGTDASPAIDRSLLYTYDGDLVKTADNTAAAGGLLGLFADYNGTSAPNGSVVRKALDGRLPLEITLSSFGAGGDAGYDTPNQTYSLDQIGCEPTTSSEKSFTDQAVYSLAVGEHFYRGRSNGAFRIILNASGSNWDVVGPRATGGATVRGRIAGSEYSFPTAGSGGTNFDSYPDGTITGKIDEYTAPTAAQKNRYTLELTTPNSGSSGAGNGVYVKQPLVQTLKVGFGITFGESNDGSAPFTLSGDPTTAYQCFPPTDTAPPFRATATGIRTIPEDAKNKVFIEYASPNAGTNPNDPVTSITFSRLKFTGDFGDTPNDLSSVEGVGQTISLADGPSDTFNRKIKFTYKNPNGTTQTFGILATTDPTA